MGPDFPSLLRGLGKFLAVVVASTLVGAALGIGLSKLSGDEATSSAPLAAAPAAAPARTGATGASGATGADDAEPQAPRIRVLSSTLVPATTPSGRKRRRARVAVRLRVTARGDKATLGTARLISGDDELTTDPQAADAAGDLLDPISAGKSATGELRFETAGALTTRLADQKRARLRIGDRRLPLRLTTP